MVPGFEASSRDDDADEELTLSRPTLRHSMRPGEIWLRNWVSIRTNHHPPHVPNRPANLHHQRDRERRSSAETEEEQSGGFGTGLGLDLGPEPDQVEENEIGDDRRRRFLRDAFG